MPIAAVSSKGQVTLPAKARRQLGIKAPARVSIEVQGKLIVIRPIPSLLDLAGTFGPPSTPEEEEESMIAAAVDRGLGRRRW
jgi:AbrB family looped-hinge helix DNA binding protein